VISASYLSRNRLTYVTAMSIGESAVSGGSVRSYRMERPALCEIVEFCNKSAVKEEKHASINGALFL